MNHEISQGETALPAIKITDSDFARLEDLLRLHAPIRTWKAVAFLAGEMERATIIAESEAEPTLLTLGSRAAFLIDGRDDMTVATLALPGARDLYEDPISILTPVGAALIGLSVGQSMPYAAPDGRVRTVTVAEVLHQPQAAMAKGGQGA